MSRHLRKRIELSPLPHVAAIYCRVSTVQQDSGDKSSLATQEAGCQQWAIKHGWDVDEQLIFRDRHSGEELWERPALTHLREAAKQRRFGVVVCHSIDRLSRNPVHLGILLEEFARLGVAVEFTTEVLDDSPEAGLIRYIRGYAAQVENEKRRERQMRATRAKVERGYPVSTGRPAYGYQWTDSSKTQLEANPATAAVVQRIFTQYAAGVSLRGVAASLMADHVPTPTGRGRRTWDPASVRQILTRPIYWGAPAALRYKAVALRPDERPRYARKTRTVLRAVDEQVPLPASVAPTLVSPTVAATCQRRLQQNQQLTSTVPKHPEAALLRGLVRCGVCGGSVRAVSSQCRTHANGYTPTYYTCKNGLRLRRDAPGYCQPRPVSARSVDAAVWQQIANLLQHPEVIRSEIEKLQGGPAPLAADIAAVDARLASLDKRIRSLVDGMALCTEPIARESLAAQLDLLAKERRGCERERAALDASIASWQSNYASLDALQRELDGLADEIDGWDYAQRRKALLALGTRVVLHEPGHEPRVELSIRLPVSGRLALGNTLVVCDTSADVVLAGVKNCV